MNRSLENQKAGYKMLEEELNRERSKSSQYGDGAENSITKKQLLNKDKQIESLREFIEKLEK